MHAPQIDTIAQALALLARELPVTTHRDGTGARVILPNGTQVSIVTGWGSYSLTGRDDANRKVVDTLSIAPDAEVAALTYCGTFLACSQSLEEGYSEVVWGHQSPAEVLAFVDRVAAIRPDGPCFCPDCARRAKS